MVLAPRLDLRQSQTLVMTPQLQQAIKLLQLNNIELTAYVEQELEQNPLLERDEGQRDQDIVGFDGPDGGAGEFSSDRDGDGPGLDNIDFERQTSPELPADKSLDIDYDNTYTNDGTAESGAAPSGDRLQSPTLSDNYSGGGTGAGGGGFDGDLPGLEETLSGDISLREYLMQQISVEILDPVERIIAAHLLDNLNEAGYFVGDTELIALALDCDVVLVEGVLVALQDLDPPGIFARDLSECLAAQLREKNRLDPAMQALLDNLDLVGKRDIPGLIKACGVDQEDIQDMVLEIRALTPKPALAFDMEIIQPVVPDVLMRSQSGGGWFIELNSETLPRVLVNNVYYTQISKSAQRKEDKQYLADCFQTANWLVKSLHQRATTIMKVASEIVRQQDAFFRKGVQHLKPLVLRDIAEAIEMHESTVSRVTSNKYIATPRGIFELKYFFTPAINSASGGDAHSAESVRHRIKALVDNEDPKKILSDDKIVELLKADGVDIARRTVAKYREALGIPSSVQRRREKSVKL